MEDKDCRVNFAMAEALAFGSLALHRTDKTPGNSDNRDKAAQGLNKGAYAVRYTSSLPLWDAAALISFHRTLNQFLVQMLTILCYARQTLYPIISR